MATSLSRLLPLNPLRDACVQPARKSRPAVSGLFVYEEQKQEQEQQRRAAVESAHVYEVGLLAATGIARCLLSNTHSTVCCASNGYRRRKHAVGLATP